MACVSIPSFRLRAALGRSWDPEIPSGLVSGLGPQARMIELSPAASAAGALPGMRLAEARGHCSGLRDTVEDPVRAEEVWERVTRRLEVVVIEVEAQRAGEAFFAVDGLLALRGGSRALIGAVREALGAAFSIGFAPGRFSAALAAARAGGSADREFSVADARLGAFLGPHPVEAIRGRVAGASGVEEAALVGALERLGITTLAQLAALGEDHLADRFGRLRLARGEEEPLCPRSVPEDVSADVELADGTAGLLLERALDMAVDRLLACEERKGRTILALRLTARLVSGGSWSVDQTLGRPSGEAKTIAPLMRRRLQGLPRPATTLSLRVLALDRPADQLAFERNGSPGQPIWVGERFA
ncbi:MAG: hypothetical protein H0X42_04490 [Solirubrobacterales bacterium]|nr:hypothetical protein [Solirubrobacterales bacterium]